MYTSTEMSKDRSIELHHEMSYAHNWPSLLYFYCDVPPTEGGATPLASERRVFPRIPDEVKERFIRHGARYVRNYGPDVDLPWQEVFQTTDRREVDAYCHASGTQTVWGGDDNLRAIANRQAVTTHPRTGETVWFNHAHLFHPSTLPAEVVEVMVAEYGLDGLAPQRVVRRRCDHRRRGDRPSLRGVRRSPGELPLAAVRRVDRRQLPGHARAGTVQWRPSRARRHVRSPRGNQSSLTRHERGNMVLIRHAAPAELEEPVGFTVNDPVGVRRRRPAPGRGGGRPVSSRMDLVRRRRLPDRRACPVWWGRADSERPLALDCLHVLPDAPNRAALATELLLRGHTEFNAEPEYQLILRTSGRGADPGVADAVAWRSDAAKAAGLTDVIERLRFEWTPAAGVPAPSERLVFRPASDEEFLAVFRRVAVGSLDVATQRDLAATDADSQAQGDLEFYRSCPGERSWWRLAETTDGELVGFAIPSATPYNRNVGYLAVVPELRGRGYVDDILGEITRVHAADGADCITATADVPNTPMAAAFERANYQVTEVRMVFRTPAG